MDDSVLVSVIVPVYNAIPYLNEALDSVINQTYKNIEIIIVDDGSSDGSGAICDQYAQRDSRVLVIHQANQGLSVAHNTGLDRITGDIVAFLDSDDAYVSTFLEEMIDIMTKNNAEIAGCNFVRKTTKERMEVDEKESSTHEFVIYNRKEALCALADLIIPHFAWNKIYKSDLWSTVCFPVGHVYEDIDTIFRVFSLTTKVSITNKVLYLYRKHNASITRTFSKKSMSDWMLAIDHFLDFIRSNTPEIFTTKHINEVQVLQLRTMISFYARSVKNSEDERQFEVYLRNRILMLRQELDPNSLDLRIRVFFLVLHCPWVIRLVYQVRSFMRSKIRKN